MDDGFEKILQSLSPADVFAEKLLPRLKTFSGYLDTAEVEAQFVAVGIVEALTIDPQGRGQIAEGGALVTKTREHFNGLSQTLLRAEILGSHTLNVTILERSVKNEFWTRS